MKIKIFITGITSLLIKQFLTKINFNEYEVTGLSRNQINFENQNIKIIKGNLLEFDTYKEYIETSDIIIYSAAVTHSYNIQDYWQINYHIVKKIVNFIKFTNKKFIFISTRTAEKKCGDYGYSKYKTEEYIKKTLKDWLIFKPSEIFGINKNEGIEDLINKIMNNFIFFVPNNKKNLIYPIFIDDVINLMYDFIFIKQLKNEIIYLNGNEGYRLKTLIKLSLKKLKKKGIIFEIPRFLMYIIYFFLKTFKIKIGIVPDQIPRLYCNKKKYINKKYKFKNILDYLIEKNKFNNIAQDYLNIRINEYGFAGTPNYFNNIRLKYINLFLKNYFKNKIILEAGCGQENLFLSNKTILSINLDASFKMLLKNPGKNKINGDIINLSLKKNSIDVITLINVLHHLDKNKIEKVLNEFKLILKEKGKIIICEHNPYNPFVRYIFRTCSFDAGCEMCLPGFLLKLATKLKFKLFAKKYILFFPEKLKKLFFLEKYFNNIPLGGQYIIVLEKNEP